MLPDFCTETTFSRFGTEKDVNTLPTQAGLRDNMPNESRYFARLFAARNDDMAKRGTGYFDRRGNFFKSPRDATASDIAALLGQIGDGESLAPGIAHLLIDQRPAIETLFAEHDDMMAEFAANSNADVTTIGSKIAKLPSRPTG